MQYSFSFIYIGDLIREGLKKKKKKINGKFQ